ncbi:ABC transporter substrate-binding protein [Skermania piniformis]|uniref:ABC transporter substrate-binding protein n=1 Tax=Skermania pinensis TaxID=39122 RepID=A0ABX8S9G9_9ACTN|nr:ABC transporter substrate-binding protein [Skermania piniformis]QXQ13812.1 ABC transporter substrate-binding protein [Skermania piniformis]
MKLRSSLIPKAVLAAASVALLTVSACSSDDSSSSAGSTTAGSSAGSTGASAAGDRGPITYAEGQDTTENGVIRQIIDKWNAAHPNEQVTFKEQAADADAAHDDFVQHLQAKQADYDVLGMDVVWTAEFAAKGWLQPLTDQYALDTTGLITPTVDSATYNGTLYAAPKNTNGGLLFYRKDLVPDPPKTWSDLIAKCPIAKQNNIGCYAGQFANYEGLTVNTAEAVNARGGSFVGPDGKTPTVDSPEARAGLQQLVDGFKSGDIPADAITFKEQESQQAFEDGKLLFLRNWPYVYGTAAKDSSKVKDKYAVAPLPGVNGIGTSSLGGYNLGISAYSKHKDTALDFVKFVTGEDAQRIIGEGQLPPVRESLYADPALVSVMPYLPTLKESIMAAVPRPVSPFYRALSTAVHDNAYAALKGEKSVDQAITDMQKGIETAGAN